MGLKVYHCNEWHNEFTEFYRKDEVKKVIKELKAQKAQAEDDCAYWKTKAQRERHHKYKRCLGMAKWCMTEYIQSKCLDFTNTEQWYWRRWHILWRDLAKKFKEAK